MRYVDVVETVDHRFMVIVNGFQWAPAPAVPDRSGAYAATWPTKEEAWAAWRLSPDAQY